MIKVLKKYGVPPKICAVVERLYKGLKVVFKLGKLKAEISQGVGVRQGDNMAPVLFLFLMNAFSDLLDDAYEREGIERIEVCKESDDTFRKGQLFRHDVGKCLKSKSVEMIVMDRSIYVDDMALPYTSRAQLQKGAQIAQQILEDLGMEMHIGKKKSIMDADGNEQVVVKASKTECIFFPASGYFKERAIESGASEEDISLISMGEEEEAPDSKRSARTKLEDNLYDSCSETQDVPVKDRFVSYCKHFKYLGSWMTYSLRDDKDIDMRISAAGKAMGALNYFYSRKEISMQSK
ncbi:hypothetical protein ACHAWF_006408 [Thalassiosira exigua]